MLLTITTTARPATDLGFLLVKHPDRVRAFEQSFGTAHVFYPEAGEDRCTAALLLDVDPIRLAKARRTPDFSLGQYVNDRPYAASSLLASAMANVFRTAMRGRSADRPELTGTPIPLSITLPALPCRGDEAVRLFAPLGWRVDARRIPLDDGFPEWGDSRYVTLTLEGETTLAEALNQLYVLLPVLDRAKHYWVAPDEVDKLLRSGDGWLAGHPERDHITRRYLAGRRALVRTALARLADSEDATEDALDPEPAEDRPLAERRIDAVLAALRAEGATGVIDLGCGSGRLLSRLVGEPGFTTVAGADVSARAVAAARRRFDPERTPAAWLERLSLFTAALTYADARFQGHDAAVLMEVIEHVDPPRLPAVERVVFGDARPRVLIVTTPNAEYNARYEGLDGFRHPDHRFEWTRAEFAAWAGKAAETYGYRVRYVPVGDEDPNLGAPTQMGVFTR